MAKNEIEVNKVVELMDNVLSDNSVPRNIRRAVDEAKIKIRTKLDSTNLGGALYLLDDISNDINMPSHTRTEIWGIISELEALKEKVK